MQLGLATFGWDAVAAISTIAIAILGYLIDRRLRLSAKRAERYQLLVEYRREIIAFSGEFFQATAAAIAQCCQSERENCDFGECEAISETLSALADKGRFFFPNYVDGSSYGKEKGPAFEGYRREQTYAILAACYALRSLVEKENASINLEMARRNLGVAGQPTSEEFDPSSAKSIIFEARRSYLNSVIPLTLPREWMAEFNELLGPVAKTPEAAD